MNEAAFGVKEGAEGVKEGAEGVKAAAEGVREGAAGLGVQGLNSAAESEGTYSGAETEGLNSGAEAGLNDFGPICSNLRVLIMELKKIFRKVM